MPAARSLYRPLAEQMGEPVEIWSLADKAFMSRALVLARAGLGETQPNPSVGCVLVRDGLIVGEGRTQAGGRPHGEAMALTMAGSNAGGSHAYVTLEPCAHESARGPACSSSLIAAGVAAVTISVLDPDPRTRGIGASRLEAAGIHVRLGLLEQEGQAQIAGFEKRLRTGLPWVHVGRDDGTFDLVLSGGSQGELAAHLAQLGAQGVMRVCLLAGSPVAEMATALNLVDSAD
ncbi:bifunctional diaminohydroxyphosphoribosylaminopyrimidine deaminase/5-amino-6-(5-phosphoribosylamino)uracil reductase RibD [Aquidulcibacter sp.]|uniref:bifunctional diaminohydroxyphosphoribosylaminopyrimidine deaminase/5-amino-6-(5-phosphoribosylamino)uracil reductase RibD n=1 Tax=Aquidulcibacter sp. TaxID=2052990 RepID=UPI0025BA4AE9|nr:bifunctional diaminohydroxyphosphoribosylaminopyrimidine deaminase/5-amino-6-(5-phosphoribosylamino)uracil reductase RibD [Aquidulcibacter sp.]